MPLSLGAEKGIFSNTFVVQSGNDQRAYPGSPMIAIHMLSPQNDLQIQPSTLIPGINSRAEKEIYQDYIFRSIPEWPKGISGISYDRMQIFIKAGKGKKDR